MGFRIGYFSIRRSSAFALFALEDYQQKLDRYRNGKPIVRISGPIAKNTIPIEQINESFVKSFRRRRAIVDTFNQSGGLSIDTKATPSRPRARKPVRVRRASGSTFIRIQNVTVPEMPNGTRPILPTSNGGRAALMSLAGIAGVAGAMYLAEQANRSPEG